MGRAARARRRPGRPEGVPTTSAWLGGSAGIPALDGIRALAVALVLADHGGIPGVPGGFIGVDVFFVLSGFLITSLLLDELGRTGGIDLPGFWVRRARRLLPALIVMVMAVVVLRELFPSDAVAAVRDDAVAAFFWIANWVFVFRHTDYFTQGDPPSPLQHTWSLAVEEQYYVVWPLVLVAVAVLLAWLARRRPNRPTLRTVRWVVFGLAAAGAAASAIAASLLVSDASLNRVYFGTDTRVQALLVGAAASALLVGDWSSLTRYGTQLRSRWAGWVAQVAAGHRAGDAGRRGALRDGQCAGVPRRSADRGRGRGGPRGRTGGAAAARAGRARAGLSAVGVAGRDLLRRLPLALADLPRAQR